MWVEGHLQVLLVTNQPAVFQGHGPEYQGAGEDEIVLPAKVGEVVFFIVVKGAWNYFSSNWHISGVRNTSHPVNANTVVHKLNSIWGWQLCTSLIPKSVEQMHHYPLWKVASVSAQDVEHSTMSCLVIFQFSWNTLLNVWDMHS